LPVGLPNEKKYAGFFTKGEARKSVGVQAQLVLILHEKPSWAGHSYVQTEAEKI
jgi:hypothetical protein